VLEMIALKQLKTCHHPRIASECRGGRTVKIYQVNQTVCGVLRKMPSKYPTLMVKIKDLVP
jgi:hypothetical protein